MKVIKTIMISVAVVNISEQLKSFLTEETSNTFWSAIKYILVGSHQTI